MSRAPRNSAVSRNFVHPKSKIPVTVIFILHACTLRACSDLQVESYRVAGPLVDTLYTHIYIDYYIIFVDMVGTLTDYRHHALNMFGRWLIPIPQL